MTAHPTLKSVVTRADILPMAEYAAIRKEQRRKISEIKKARRIEVGPLLDLLFRKLRHDVASDS